MGIFGAAHRWKGQKGPPSVPKICDTYPTTMKIGTVISYLRIIQKIYEFHIKTNPSSSADIQIFSPEVSNFGYINKYRYILHFKYIILNIFFEFLSVVLINVVPTQIMLAKLATVGLLKMKTFRSKGCDVIVLSMTSLLKFYYVTLIML